MIMNNQVGRVWLGKDRESVLAEYEDWGRRWIICLVQTWPESYRPYPCEVRVGFVVAAFQRQSAVVNWLYQCAWCRVAAVFSCISNFDLAELRSRNATEKHLEITEHDWRDGAQFPMYPYCTCSDRFYGSDNFCTVNNILGLPCWRKDDRSLTLIVHIHSEINPTRCNNCVYSSQWLYSTCFGWQFHPSSGVQCCSYSSHGGISNTWFFSARSLYSKMELMSVRCLKLCLDPQFKNLSHHICAWRWVECGNAMVNVGSCFSATFGIPSRPYPGSSLSLFLMWVSSRRTHRHSADNRLTFRHRASSI